MLSLSSCTFTFQQLEFHRASSLISTKSFESAVRSLNRVIESDPNTPVALKAAVVGAPIAHLEVKDFQIAGARHALSRSKIYRTNFF
jgi:hypothetical protein